MRVVVLVDLDNEPRELVTTVSDVKCEQRHPVQEPGKAGGIAPDYSRLFHRS
jgi:hypothetical protein